MSKKPKTLRNTAPAGPQNQFNSRDEYVGWLNSWKRNYNNLVSDIKALKSGDGRVNVRWSTEEQRKMQFNRYRQSVLAGLRFEARMMMISRDSVKHANQARITEAKITAAATPKA